jgi:WXG100 family type VII secretion target
MTEFNVNYAALDTAASGIQASSQAINGEMGELDGVFKQIAWEGQHQAAYHQMQTSLQNSVTTMNELLAKMGQLVTGARELYAQTEQRQTQVWS